MEILNDRVLTSTNNHMDTGALAWTDTWLSEYLHSMIHCTYTQGELEEVVVEIVVLAVLLTMLPL